MDSHNSDGFDALALEPLCQAAAQELLMRSYTVRTLNRYKRVGEQLADFARAQGLPAEYMRELALPFTLPKLLNKSFRAVYCSGWTHRTRSPATATCSMLWWDFLLNPTASHSPR